MTDRQREKMYKFGERYASPPSVIKRHEEVTLPVAGDVLTCVKVELTPDGFLKFGNSQMASKDRVIREVSDAVTRLSENPTEPVFLFLYGLNMRMMVEEWGKKYPRGFHAT